MEKVYSGGARNFGIEKALKDCFDLLVCCDADCLINPMLLKQYIVFFQMHPNELVAAGAYIPSGNFWQTIDTLLNASKFLFRNTNTVKYFDSLSSANFAVNMKRFRERPVFFRKVFDGDDWLFFNDLKNAFGLSELAFLPAAGFRHLSSTDSWQRCLKSSRRYANAYCHKVVCGQAAVFDKYPYLHYSVPRFWLILIRLFRAGWFRYIYLLPVLVVLDLLRSRYIVQKLKGA
jgi:glycosyltransferase involved in cell wall biosynthesis